MAHLRLIRGGLRASPVPVEQLPYEVIKASKRLAEFLRAYNDGGTVL